MPDSVRAFDSSNRSEILGEAILPFLGDGTSVLDVGCGYSCYPRFQGTILPDLIHAEYDDVLYHGIDNRADVIIECQKNYPWGDWTVVDASQFAPSRIYDAVFHLGFDRTDLSNAWMIHGNLLQAGMGPRVVLLEAGSPVGMPSKHLESFRDVQGTYLKYGYIVQLSSEYLWNYNVTQPARKFAILERG